MAAYFDRLVRSLEVQAEVVRRVEAAGGRVLALDVGQVTNGTAGHWLSGTMLGAVAEYHRRSTGDRVRQAHIRAVDRGAWPGRVPPGYRRGPDGVLEADANASTVTEAFRMRADGAPIRAVREHLAGHGVKLSHHGVQRLLASNVVLGHIIFGDLVKLSAHPAIVTEDVWKRAQEASAPRGRQPKSERLLARLGLLRCGSCGARMVVSSTHGGRHPIYRCPPTGDCDRRVAVAAELVEGFVVEAFLSGLGDLRATGAAVAGELEATEAALEAAERELAAFLSGVQAAGLPPGAFAEGARERQEGVDRAHLAHDDARGRAGLRSLPLAAELREDWPTLSHEDKRAFLRAGLATVTVKRGRAPIHERARVVWKGEAVEAVGQGCWHTFSHDASKLNVKALFASTAPTSAAGRPPGVVVIRSSSGGRPRPPT